MRAVAETPPREPLLAPLYDFMSGRSLRLIRQLAEAAR